MLVDFYKGNFKVYLDGIDQGYAITDCEDLKKGVYFITVDNDSSFKGSVISTVSSSPPPLMVNGLDLNPLLSYLKVDRTQENQ